LFSIPLLYDNGDGDNDDDEKEEMDEFG